MKNGGDSPAAGAETAWTRLEPECRWSDLVLPESQLTLLRSIAGNADDAAKQCKLVLFGGDPGTGKTMAARILANELSTAVLSLDVSESRSPDRATIDQLLAAALDENAIVVFDHADGLLRRRTREKQGEGSTEVTALLERCRQQGGIVVFTSRGPRGISEALAEQFDFVIEFPFPERDARRKVWRRGLTKGARVTESDLDELAASFKLPGAAIRTCCAVAIAAAMDERVKMNRTHLARALDLEYHHRLMSEDTRAALAELKGVEESGEETPHEQPVPPAASRVARFRPARRSQLSPGAKRLRRRSPWLVLLATILAAGLGFLAGHTTTSHASSESAVKHATVGQVALAFPSSWRRTAALASPQLGLTNELALSSAGALLPVLLVGTSDAAAAPSYLPSALLAALPTAPTAQLVALGAREFYRYSPVAIPGQSGQGSLYVLPTTAGTIVADCAVQSAASCQRVLATLRLVSGSPLALAPSEAYAAALDGVISKLNAVRHSVASRLSHLKTPLAVARAETRMANAQTAAAASLSDVAAGAAAGANTVLADALLRAASAFHALALAASEQNRRAFGAGEASLVQATKAENAAYTQLAELGYRTGPS